MAREGSGPWGEERAAAYLRRRGWQIVGTNYACRFGEIDIIARRFGVLAFVEVKTRRSASHGEAREFVTAAKRQRLIAAARLYLAEHETELQPRFDVIEIYAPEGEKTLFPRIVHLENAFD
ncbi:MAG: YraN family protein [Oscillospiraceae bacterium]|nr:YraN family protein [Oscillospiraceae bacterium]